MRKNQIMQKKPVVLCILDGWGIGAPTADNAVFQAKTPSYDRLMATCPNTTLRTDGLAVGLPEGQFGNSEVGHTNIGAGRVVMQDLPRISLACQDGSLAANPVLQQFIDATKKSGGAVHLMGVLSDGGVHAHQDHISTLAKILSAAGVVVHVHIFTDGRDTPPSSAVGYVSDFVSGLPANVKVATVSGRFYAMDRDNRWERVSQAWAAIVKGEGRPAADANAAVAAAYAAGETDEFIMPTVMHGYAGLRDSDAVLMANYRSDRVREILRALVSEKFDGFDRGAFAPVRNALGMAEYADDLNKVMGVVFPPVSMEKILGEVLADAGLKQLRAAETEKYPHVTFFLNGGREAPYEGEERLLVASPKVATYDLQPEMSAVELTDKLLDRLAAQDAVIVNFANPDMVGHTGSVPAAIKAVETVDTCLGRIADKIAALGGVLLVTADHGNCEKMFDAETGQPYTAHTTNPVPFILCGAGAVTLHPGKLADIAPTMLQILQVSQPAEMTGVSLIAVGA